MGLGANLDDMEKLYEYLSLAGVIIWENMKMFPLVLLELYRSSEY
jgi:hypothetical protein